MTHSYALLTGCICLLLASCLSSCTSREERAAEAAVQMFTALENHRFAEASAYATQDTYSVLETVADEAENYQRRPANVPEISYEVTGRKIADDAGELTVTITAGNRVRTEIIPVVWVNNAWKVRIARKQLSMLHFIAFNDRFERIVAEKHSEHSGRDHAYVRRTDTHKH